MSYATLGWLVASAVAVAGVLVFLRKGAAL